MRKIILILFQLLIAASSNASPLSDAVQEFVKDNKLTVDARALGEQTSYLIKDMSCDLYLPMSRKLRSTPHVNIRMSRSLTNCSVIIESYEKYNRAIPEAFFDAQEKIFSNLVLIITINMEKDLILLNVHGKTQSVINDYINSIRSLPSLKVADVMSAEKASTDGQLFFSITIEQSESEKK